MEGGNLSILSIAILVANHTLFFLYSALMTQCWHVDPSARPTFQAICLRVKEIFDYMLLNEAEYMRTHYAPLHRESDYVAVWNGMGANFLMRMDSF